LRDDLRFLLRGGDEQYVYFVELRGRGIFLRASPIDVSAIVREHLLDRMQTTVLTSATLTVEGTFDYVRSRLGITTASEVRLASEFDFRRQAILYLPLRMPDPRAENFAVAASREVVELLKRTKGRAFVLFTSYATMRAVQAMAEMALDFPILAQGSAPRSQLLNQFRGTPHAVLFATSSFWQGVDVVGEALSCVIVDKLPFASPGDPITAARIDAIRARGGDPFGEYQVPSPSSHCSRGSAGSSVTGAIGACSRCSTRGCEPRATAGASSTRCRPRRSCTSWTMCRRFFRTEPISGQIRARDLALRDSSRRRAGLHYE
jgi:ATP-dependent DNA helicase DinG